MRILAIGHSATLSGAPLLLLEYLRFLAEKKNIRLRCLLGEGGPLESQYRQIADTFIAQPSSNFGRLHVAAKFVGLAANPERNLNRWLNADTKPECIYANTVASLPLLSVIRPELENVPTICHIHELTSVLSRFKENREVGSQLSSSSKIIAASKSVKSALIEQFAVAESQIDVVYEYLCRDRKSAAEIAEARCRVRSRFNLSENDLLVLCLGTVEWRKGSDLVPQIARHCLSSEKQIHFISVGKPLGMSVDDLMLDAKKLGVADRLHFVGTTDKPSDYLAASDIFALTSREDPYPLAMLEAALYGLPMVCFAKSGGAEEFATNECAIVVPYLDCTAMADAIKELACNKELYNKIAVAANQKVKTEHSLEASVEKIWAIQQAACTGPQIS